MVGWFRPTCPVDVAAKRWTEKRLDWLSREFDTSAFVDKPSDLCRRTASFRTPMTAPTRSVRQMLDRVCEYMGVAPESIELDLFHDVQRVPLIDEAGNAIGLTAAGTYSEGEEKWIVRINTEDLHEPISIVGTMAHELAHVRLMGEARVSGDEFDNELLTDLTTVFHGLGIFLANHPRAWPSEMTYWPGTQLKRPEYMSCTPCLPMLWRTSPGTAIKPSPHGPNIYVQALAPTFTKVCAI